MLAQRDIDARFRSVFIANTNSGLQPITSINGLTSLRGKRFSFGSESSTSGRLMPQHFLAKAGVTPANSVVAGLDSAAATTPRSLWCKAVPTKLALSMSRCGPRR